MITDLQAKGRRALAVKNEARVAANKAALHRAIADTATAEYNLALAEDAAAAGADPAHIRDVFGDGTFKPPEKCKLLPPEAT